MDEVVFLEEMISRNIIYSFFNSYSNRVSPALLTLVSVTPQRGLGGMDVSHYEKLCTKQLSKKCAYINY